LVLFAYVFGPLVSILGGVELATHLGMNVGVHWSIWLTSWFVFQMLFLGLFWPLFVIVVKPFLWIIETAVKQVSRLISFFDSFLWNATAVLGMAIPFWSYWRSSNDRNQSYARWFPIPLMGFTLVSFAAHLLLFVMPAWRWVSDLLGTTAPWLTFFTHIIVSLFVVLSPFVGCGFYSVRIVTFKGEAGLFGPVSFMLAVNLWAWTELSSKYPIQIWLPGLFGLYLATFLIFLPVLGILSTRRLLAELIKSIARISGDYWNWAHQYNTQRQFLEDINLILVSLTAFASYRIFNFFGFHPIITIIHTIAFTFLSFVVVDYWVWGWLFNILFSMAVSTLSLTSGFHPLIIIGLHAVTLFLGLFLCHVLLIPLATAPLVLLTRIIPHRAIAPTLWLRDRAETLIHWVGSRWERMLTYSFDDRSAFSCMFGWLMTTFLVVMLTLEYGKYYFLSGWSPFVALGHLQGVIVPSLQQLLLYTPTTHNMTLALFNSANTTLTSVAINSTASTVVSTTYATAEAGTQSIANTTSAFIWGPSTAAVFGHYLIDSFLFLSALINLLILLGKAASSGAAPSFALVSFSYAFIGLRITLLTSTHYGILTELVSVELGFLCAFIIAPAIYSILRRITAPVVPTIAPHICIPFERLFSMQQWMWRVTVRQYYNLKDLMRSIWNSLFGAGIPPPSAKPLYQRPRRYA
jgi:hypothetical protein